MLINGINSFLCVIFDAVFNVSKILEKCRSLAVISTNCVHPL